MTSPTTPASSQDRQAGVAGAAPHDLVEIGLPREVLRLLLATVPLLAIITLTRTELPRILLYGIGAGIGLAVVWSLRRTPEALLALVTLYLPMSKFVVIDFGHGLNGTTGCEALLLLGLLLSKRPASTSRREPFPFSKTIFLWLLTVTASVATAMAGVGFNNFLWDYASDLRGFLDQFVIYYLVLHAIRDRNMARRMVIYLMISATLVYLFGIHEWIGTRNAATISQSRLLGPVGQPNVFAAQIIYALPFFIAFAATYFPRARTLRVLPSLLMGVKVLLGAFSRAGYLALALAVGSISLFKGFRFVFLASIAAIGVYVFAPSLVPGSLKARVAQTYEDRAPGTEIDRSAESRFTLWAAAVKMTEESPIFGKGFDQFQRLSNQYTAEPVEATDNQNFFLYVASNMGLPSLLLFCWLLLQVTRRSYQLARRSGVSFDRTVGLAGLGLIPGLITVNMFGTHVLDIAVDFFFWLYVATLAHLTRARPV